MARVLALSALFLTFAGSAFAHPGHADSGFLHPLTGADHLLAMVAVGMWAAFLATRRPAAAFWVPMAFMLMMVRLNGCVACETDSFRAMRGCPACAHQTLRRYKGEDEELLGLFEQALGDVRKFAESHPRVGILAGDELPPITM